MNCPTPHSWLGGKQNLRVILREGLFHAGGEPLKAQGAGRVSGRTCASIKTAVMGTSLAVWRLRLCLPVHGVWV